MKIKLSVILPVITALFVGLTLGLFLGRNPAGGSVTVSVPARQVSAAVPVETQAEPSGQPDSLPVNINPADAAELAALPVSARCWRRGFLTTGGFTVIFPPWSS